MVSIRSVHQSTRPPFEQWLAQLPVSDQTKDKLRKVSDQPEILLVGQEMVEILHDLHMDDETLQAALIFPYCQIHDLSHEQVAEKFGDAIANLVSGVRKMDASNKKARRRNTRYCGERMRYYLCATSEQTRHWST